MDNKEEIIRRIKEKRQKYYKTTNENKKSKYISNLFTRTLLAVIVVLLSAIFINTKEDNLFYYKKYLFEKSLSFHKITNTYNKVFGKVMPLELDKGTTKTVFNEGISYQNIEKFEQGYKLDLTQNLVTSLYDGIVVYIGDKDNYGSTIIVQGSDGVDIWYGNVTNVNVTLYDYIDKNKTLGEAIDNSLYLVFNKEEQYLGYENYLK